MIRWLAPARTPLVKGRIVRSLTGEKAVTPAALKPLVDEFRAADDVHLKWAIGNALATLADASIADELIELAADRGHGRSREMLMDALARTKEERALDLLVELVDDDEVAGHKEPRRWRASRRRRRWSDSTDPAESGPSARAGSRRPEAS